MLTIERVDSIVTRLASKHFRPAFVADACTRFAVHLRERFTEDEFTDATATGLSIIASRFFTDLIAKNPEHGFDVH